MNKLSRWLFLCLILLGSVAAHSQTVSEDYILKHWSVEDGMPVNVVVSMAQTPDGYIWMSTYDGLVRFDGDQFKVFNSENIPALPTNRFISVKMDRHNNVWFLSEKVQNNRVLIRYNAGEFTVFNTQHGLKSGLTMHLGIKGNLFVVTEGNALYYDGQTFQPFGEELSGKSVRSITRDAGGDYWFATNEGVFRYGDSTWTQLTEKDGLDSRNVFAVKADLQGRIWMSTDVGVNVLENEKITSTPIDLTFNRNRGQTFSENRHTGQIFLRSGNYSLHIYKEGEFLYYPSKSRQGVPSINITTGSTGTNYVTLQNELYANGKLIFTSKNRIGGVFEDQTGNIWISQLDGVDQLKPRLIKTYNENIGSTYSVIEDHEGKVWATQNFQDLFELQGDTFQKVTDKVKDHMTSPFSRAMYGLHSSTDSLLWIGSSVGVFRWDKKSEPILMLAPTGEGQSRDPRGEMREIRAIKEDVEGNMWYGSANGIYRLDKNERWQHFGKVDGKDILEVRLIYESQDSTLWFGTNGNGLLQLKDGKLTQINTDHGLSGNIIRSMHEDDEGILWVGTEGWGLNRIERNRASELNSTQITVYKTQNGLFDNMIHQILEDDQGRFWMNSNRGIFWVNKSELTAFAKGEISSIYSFFYNEQDGLPGREGNGGVQTAGFKSKKGELWFPMQGGVVRIDPARVKTSPLNVFIEEVITSDSSWFVANIEEKVFPLGVRDLQIRFAALDFSTSPANIRYRYQLDGEDEAWVEAGNRKEASYNNLAPGTYTFRVMANNGGGWLENEASLQIRVPHFFYETYWFYGIIVLVIALIVYAGVNWRIRRLKQQGRALEKQVALRTHDLIREKEETEHQKEIATEALKTIEKQASVLKELDQAKSRFFTNISHEFRTPLTLIIGPLEHQIQRLREGLASDEEDMEVALRNSKRLLRLVNQILEVARLESGHTQLQAQLIDMRTVIAPITDSFKSLAERNGTQLISQWPDEPVMIYVDVDLIEKAIVNLISNAFKFTPKGGKIEVIVMKNDEQISICIKDNGPGIPKEEQTHVFERFYQVDESSNSIQAGTGIGLSLVHELVTLHKGSIDLISEAGMGAEFLINLKTGHAHLRDDQFVAEKTTENGKSNLLPDGFTLAETQPPEANGQIVQEQPTLLIVEDNEDIRSYVRKHLSETYNVLEAENGLVGFQMTQEALPDLVISDVMMPVSDGYELCRKIKQHPDLDFIPVILLTAKAETSMKIEGLELGADDYVIKPFEINELKARVHNLIKSRQKLKERLAEIGMTSESPDLMGWVDTPFANRVRSVIEQHIGDEDFSVAQLAEEVNVGRTTLYSRIVELTGKTPSEMIKLMRLYQAAQLLKEDAGNISEIAYATGFKSISHFSKTFKAEFEVAPTQYASSILKTSNT